MVSNFRLLMLIVMSIGIVSGSYARSCSEYEFDKAEYFAMQAGEQLVSNFGGGQDIVTDVTSCRYNGYARHFRLNIEVKWNGAIFRDNHYEIDGVLTVSMDGDNPKFSRTYANQNVKDLEFFAKVAAGVIILNKLSEGQ